MNDEIVEAGADEGEGPAASNASVDLEDSVDTTEAIVPASSDAAAAAEAAGSNSAAERPKVTFMGNTYDMTSLAAFASGILVLASCLTCGQLVYCLPVLPIILGIIGLAMAKQSIDAERTRLWSWLGIGGGGLAFIILAVAVVMYAAFVAFVVATSLAGNQHPYGY